MSRTEQASAPLSSNPAPDSNVMRLDPFRGNGQEVSSPWSLTPKLSESRT
jgi:hypothetical protein